MTTTESENEQVPPESPPTPLSPEYAATLALQEIEQQEVVQPPTKKFKAQSTLVRDVRPVFSEDNPKSVGTKLAMAVLQGHSRAMEVASMVGALVVNLV